MLQGGASLRSPRCQLGDTALLAAMPGFVTYYAVRTDDGGVASVTVCQDRAGTTESTRVVGEWVRTNLANVELATPEVSAGDIVLHVGTSAGS